MRFTIDQRPRSRWCSCLHPLDERYDALLHAVLVGLTFIGEICGVGDPEILGDLLALRVPFVAHVHAAYEERRLLVVQDGFVILYERHDLSEGLSGMDPGPDYDPVVGRHVDLCLLLEVEYVGVEFFRHVFGGLGDMSSERGGVDYRDSGRLYPFPHLRAAPYHSLCAISFARSNISGVKVFFSSPGSHTAMVPTGCIPHMEQTCRRCEAQSSELSSPVMHDTTTAAFWVPGRNVLKSSERNP